MFKHICLVDFPNEQRGAIFLMHGLTICLDYKGLISISENS